ncbi:MAG: hypothetical protein AAFX41_13040 [Bacteroidota bacterium]
MRQTDAFLATLDAPARWPETLVHARLVLTYTEAAVRDGIPAEVLKDLETYAPALEALLHVGFLDRTHGSGTTAATVNAVLIEAEALQLTLSTNGTHANVLVLVLRLLLALHQTPTGAFERLVAMLGSDEEARDVFGGKDYGTLIHRLAVVDVTGPAGAAEHAVSPLTLLSAGTRRLASGPIGESTGDAPHRSTARSLVQAERLVVTGAAFEIPEDLEDAFLTLAGLDLFLPPDADPDFEPGEEEFWLRDGALVADTVSMEEALLVEWIACLADAPVEMLRGRVEAE